MVNRLAALLAIALAVVSLAGCSNEVAPTAESNDPAVSKTETVGYASEEPKEEDAKESVSIEERTQDLQPDNTSKSSSSSSTATGGVTTNGNNSSSSSASSSSSSSASSGSSSSGGSGSSSAPSAPSAPVHQHSWTYHDAVTEQVWISNYVWVGWYTCGHCGAKTYTYEEASAHQEAEALQTGTMYAFVTGGYHEDQGHYETRTVSSAYHSCSCGARK